jgi:hypothetical protein
MPVSTGRNGTIRNGSDSQVFCLAHVGPTAVASIPTATGKPGLRWTRTLITAILLSDPGKFNMAPTPPKGKHVIYIYIAIAGNFGIAVVKFIAAAITCSSAILSEGIPR